MNTKNKATIFSIINCVIITAFLFATPAWSAPSKKEDNIKNPIEDNLLDQEDKKSEGKANNKVKKKIVKKAGAAAAVGVATKKVSTGIKGTSKRVEE